MTKTLKTLLLAIFTLSIFSCEEDIGDIFKDSRIEKYDSHHLSFFRIPHIFSSYELNSDVDIIQVGGSYVDRLHANITAINESESEVGLTIPNDANIPNGKYVIKVDSISDRYIAEISNHLITIIDINNGDYTELTKFDSKGTINKPFIINNNSKFNKFIFALSKDEYHGAGFYFKQTSDFTWSNDESNDGEGLSSQSFAGNYDGDNYIIKSVIINGKENSGIFTTLINGATIQNLIIEGIAISSSGNYLGTLAGQSSGHVRLRGIQTSGSISGKEYVGGLIGLAKDKLTLNDITIGTIVNGEKYVGGVIGEAYTDKGLTIDTLYNSNSFKVGTKNKTSFIGGIMGYFHNGSFNISNSNIIYTSSSEDNVEIISGSEYVGGLIGKIQSISPSTIKNTQVIAPINADKYIGGFIGEADLSNTLSITNSQLCPIIKQGDYVGGVIGLLKCSSNDLLTYNNVKIVQSNNSDIYIKGNNFVGGVFGYVDGGAVSLTGENYIMAYIEGNDCVGGIAGQAENTILDIGTPLYGKTGTDITGITIKGYCETGGVIGYLNSSTLKGGQTLKPTSGINHFDKSKASVICTITGSQKHIGGAVGSALESTISGISVHATITNDKGSYTGGIVGAFYQGGKVNSCSFSGILTGGEYTGGIAGEINYLSQITQCINYGSITGGSKTGGICGKMHNKEDEPWINECANVGNVTASHFVGGIVGYISADGKEGKDWTKIARCGNYGNITATSSDWGCVGGIVGKCDSDKIRVNHCANHGTITGNGYFKGIGGIAGSLGQDADGLEEYDNVHVYNCANTGTIISDRTSGAHMGGIVGYMEEGKCLAEDSHVERCYNCGSVGPAKEATHGGIIGHCDYYVALEYCINYGNTHDKGESMIGTVVSAGVIYNNNLYHLSGSGDDDGHSWSSTSFTEAQMSSLSTFSGFSENDWVVSQQLNMQGSGENTKSRVILKDCPFQNIVYK